MVGSTSMALLVRAKRGKNHQPALKRAPSKTVRHQPYKGFSTGIRRNLSFSKSRKLVNFPPIEKAIPISRLFAQRGRRSCLPILADNLIGKDISELRRLVLRFIASFL